MILLKAPSFKIIPYTTVKCNILPQWFSSRSHLSITGIKSITEQ